MNAKVGPRIQCRKMSHDLTCDFLTPTMQSLDVGCVCILVNEEEERDREAALECLPEALSKASVGKKKKHRVRTPDNDWSGSEEETLKETAEKIVEDENKTLQTHKNETLTMKKRSAQMKTGAGSSGSSLLSERTTNKKPAAIVSPNKRKLSAEDPENG